jgi:LacI family gluconate utilization system Gnt-I transcriptional repressor
MSPSILSVHVDQMGMARIAAQKLVEALEGRSSMTKTIDVGFRIVERDTTRLALL